MTLVFNASPLIVLAKARLLDLFITLGSPALVPQAVVDEVIRVDHPDDPARLWFQSPPAPVQIVPSPSPTSFLAAWDLGEGESAVISVAHREPDSVAILDDLAARRCAHAHGIKVMGTIGLVLLAKQNALIPEVTQSLEAIVAAGLFIAPHHLVAIRSHAGE